MSRLDYEVIKKYKFKVCKLNFFFGVFSRLMELTSRHDGNNINEGERVCGFSPCAI